MKVNIQDAINCVNVDLEETTCENCRLFGLDYSVCAEVDKIKLEALEKQNAKKYKTFVGESGIVRITYYECPCCGEIGIEHMQKHCHECGQKLDWGD